MLKVSEWGGRNNSPIHGSVHRVSCTSCRGADGRGMMMDDVLPFFEGDARDLVILGTFCFIQQAVKTYGCHLTHVRRASLSFPVTVAIIHGSKTWINCVHWRPLGVANSSLMHIVF